MEKNIEKVFKKVYLFAFCVCKAANIATKGLMPAAQMSYQMQSYIGNNLKP